MQQKPKQQSSPNTISTFVIHLMADFIDELQHLSIARWFIDFFSCIKLKPRINKANPFTEIPRNWKIYLLEPSTSSRLLSTFVGWIGIKIGQKMVKIHTQQKLFTIYYYELTERERKKIDILFVIWCCSVSHTHSSVICWANWICRLRQSAKSQQNRNRRKNTQPEKRIGIAWGATKTIH